MAEGYIRVPVTLTCTDAACDGVIYDETGVPSPEFPEAVLGTWTCCGSHTEDAGTTTSGPLAATTQIFVLGEHLHPRARIAGGLGARAVTAFDGAINRNSTDSGFDGVTLTDSGGTIEGIRWGPRATGAPWPRGSAPPR